MSFTDLFYDIENMISNLVFLMILFMPNPHDNLLKFISTYKYSHLLIGLQSFLESSKLRDCYRQTRILPFRLVIEVIVPGFG